MTLDFDATLSGQHVVVVGGGILGTMHAYMALERGAEVVHIDTRGGADGSLSP